MASTAMRAHAGRACYLAVLVMARFRQIRAEELRTEAAAIVAERRGAVLEGLKLQAAIPGVFAWLPAPPPAGERATLAYNKGHGALRCVGSGD